MREYPFTASATGTVTAAGSVTVSVGPSFPREKWLPASVSISCTGNQPTPAAPNIATCSVYAGSFVNSSTFVDETYQVLGASSSMIDGQIIYTGSQVFAVWANMTGSAGQTVTVTVSGARQIP